MSLFSRRSFYSHIDLMMPTTSILVYIIFWPYYFLFSGGEIFLDFGFDYLKAVNLGYISPKLNELVQLFHSFG